MAVVARGAHLQAIRRQGLRVGSDLGAFTANVEAADDLRELGDFDVLVCTFKSHQWPGMLPELRPFGDTRATLVTLQNGVPFWFVRDPPLNSVDPGGAIGSLFGDDRVIGGVVHVSGQIVEPGAIRQSGGLRYVFGEPNGGGSLRVEGLVALLRGAGLAAEADAKLRSTLWLKLVNNCGLNAASVLERQTIKPMLADPRSRALVRALMVEALAVGQAMGVVAQADVDARIEYAARLDDVKTSMLQDFEAGRPLETGPILGAAVELAERYGVAVPRLRETLAQLARIAGEGDA